MKKKVLTFALLGLLTLGSIVPMVAKAADSWNYGFDKSKMQWYNNYNHSKFAHYGSITKKGVTYYGREAKAGYWSRLRLDFNGPYTVSYNKHIVY